MSLKLFELVGTDESRPFSPYCWRTRMALAHKGLEADSIPWRFTEKAAIAPHGSEKVPVLLDADKAIVDSWVIANYLEDAYPERPSLFGGEGGRALARMTNWWGDIAVVGGMFPLIVADIPSHLAANDAAYFRKSREARLGKPLEEASAGRDNNVAAFRKSLDVMRFTLKTQPFLGGASPNYADYIMFGGFQWARAVSPFKLLEADEEIIGLSGLADRSCRSLSQAIATEAFRTVLRRRQAHVFVGTPARPGRIADERSSAISAGDAARGGVILPICHSSARCFNLGFIGDKAIVVPRSAAQA